MADQTCEEKKLLEARIALLERQIVHQQQVNALMERQITHQQEAIALQNDKIAAQDSTITEMRKDHEAYMEEILSEIKSGYDEIAKLDDFMAEQQYLNAHPQATLEEAGDNRGDALTTVIGDNVPDIQAIKERVQEQQRQRENLERRGAGCS